MVSYALRDFGSYTVAGRVHTVETGEPREVHFTRSAVHMVDPRGEFAVEHAYVQYFLPERRNGAPPVVLVHGGGMCGSTWETAPDGRPGWVNLLVARGYDVHVLDNVERGRSGFAPGLWPGDPLPALPPGGLASLPHRRRGRFRRPQAASRIAVPDR